MLLKQLSNKTITFICFLPNPKLLLDSNNKKPKVRLSVLLTIPYLRIV